MARREKSSPKKVVYLWGAGATHAEAQYIGAPINLLMATLRNTLGEGIATRVLRRMGHKVESSFGAEEDVDIEKLISLLAASGVATHARLVQKMRANYFDELCESLANANVLDNPRLAIELLEMHRDEKFQEEVETLSGIITTNHDGLLQVASQKVFKGVNLGFRFASQHFKPVTTQTAPPILQLHGSFSWRFALPLRVGKLSTASKYYPNTIWIPPTILKESKNYPFNKVSALAYELLTGHCDVLRVVGASLTINDWNVLSLIFNSQNHREATKGSAYLIELIMPSGSGEKIKKECAFLKKMNSIGYLTEGNFAAYKDPTIEKEPGMENPLAYWLHAKIEHHKSQLESITSVANEETAESVGAGA